MSHDPESQTGTTLRVLLRDPTNPEAWKTFVERYTPRVLAWCRQWNLQTADAQDVTQEVLQKLAQHIHRFSYDPRTGRFRAWLKTLTRHAWSDFCEQRKRAGWGSGDPQIQQFLDNRAAPAGLEEALGHEF